ncbi:MAG TPA: glycosyltransferase [Hellea balneolensis]|uniref:Glycosyltransferase n=1 Tax=Hellea balneolensis TaxID=287478 RepID=A0A7C3GM36_9PROT|nr:glycosyltransferase [Hellea balneolensis]
MGHGDAFADNARWSARRRPTRSIGLVLVCLYLICAVLIAWVFWFEISAIVQLIGYALTCFIIMMSLLKLIASLLVLMPSRSPAREAHIRTWQPGIWPRYTVLVPLYNEAHMVAPLIEALDRLEYPRERLDIIFVTEKDDAATCQAASSYLSNGKYPQFRVFQTPPSLPRTKPKALNAALSSLPIDEWGDIITIYDAEDHPHPLQLKAAAYAFAHDPALAAVQAPLGFHDTNKTFLGALFTLEYATLFHVWNPGLVKLGLPFTLGGTSNHIRREALKLIGGWDAYNVTEDADLSFRINAVNRPAHRANIGIIGFGTQEEPISSLTDWHNQRVRWLKGFLQTWCVHMRPKSSAPDGHKLHWLSRIRGALSLHITLGATLLLAFLHVPCVILLSGIMIAHSAGISTPPLPSIFYLLFCFGYSTSLLSNVVGALKANKHYLLKYIPLIPLYWLLFFIPALAALWELITSPSHWRKTPHRCTPKMSAANIQHTHLAAE